MKRETNIQHPDSSLHHRVLDVLAQVIHSFQQGQVPARFWFNPIYFPLQPSPHGPFPIAIKVVCSEIDEEANRDLSKRFVELQGYTMTHVSTCPLCYGSNEQILAQLSSPQMVNQVVDAATEMFSDISS